MISKQDYLGIHSKSADLTTERLANIDRLLTAVNRLMMLGIKENITFKINKNTSSQVSGETFGGFRPQSCTIGATHSAHKEGLAVDIYDPIEDVDTWLKTSDDARDLYEQLGLYFEHSDYTRGWSHWGLKRPASGNRFFKP